jgi:hypothetical protein
MSVSCVNELSPLAFQLAARLESYEADVEELVRHSGFDVERCRLLTNELEEVRRLGGALPQLAVDIVEMRLQHFDLMRSLCRPVEDRVAPPAEPAAALLRKQRLVVHATRQKCVRLIARN